MATAKQRAGEIHKMLAEHHGELAEHSHSVAKCFEKIAGMAKSADDGGMMADAAQEFSDHFHGMAKCHQAAAEAHTAKCEECSKRADDDAELAAEVETLSTEFAKLRDAIKPTEVTRVIPSVPVFAVPRQGARGVESQVDSKWVGPMGLDE
jgi:hypothetical protein